MVGYHEGQNSFGEYIPNFWRIYDFNIGDSYSYHTNIINYEFQTEISKTIKILSKVIIDDTIKITTSNLSYHYENSNSNYEGTPISFQYYNNSTKSTFMINHKNRIENCYGICERYNETHNLFYTEDILTASLSLTSINFVSALIRTDAIFGKVKRGLKLIEEGDSIFYTSNQIIHDSSLDFGENIGLLSFSEVLLGPATYSTLVGTIINGDTTGTIYNFPDDLGFEEKTTAKTLEFYPNPANTQITINKELFNLQIYSNLGQLVLDLNYPNQIIHLSNLSQGLYFIKGTDKENSTYTSKLIIK